MQGNKYDRRTISRVFKTSKRIMLFSGLLFIGIVIGAILACPAAGDKNHLLLADKQEGETSNIISEEPHLPISKQSEPLIDSSDGPPYEEPPSALTKKRFTVLLVGVDRRPGEKSLSNTDSLLVASINMDDGKIALLSIPRDTQVIVPGHGKNKINAAARVGKGLKTTTALIEDLIGQPIDGYVLTNFAGFKSIIDTLGGITVTVEKDMHYVTGDTADGEINLSKGKQHLNGTQALQYARFRQDALADISRTVRQQTVLKAMGKEFMKAKTITKLPWLIPQMAKCVETNLSISQLWSLANILPRVDKLEILSQTLPGNFLIENEISYWKVDSLRSHYVTKRLLEEGKTSSMFFNVESGQTIAK